MVILPTCNLLRLGFQAPKTPKIWGKNHQDIDIGSGPWISPKLGSFGDRLGDEENCSIFDKHLRKNLPQNSPKTSQKWWMLVTCYPGFLETIRLSFLGPYFSGGGNPPVKAKKFPRGRGLWKRFLMEMRNHTFGCPPGIWEMVWFLLGYFISAAYKLGFLWAISFQLLLNPWDIIRVFLTHWSDPPLIRQLPSQDIRWYLSLATSMGFFLGTPTNHQERTIWLCAMAAKKKLSGENSPKTRAGKQLSAFLRSYSISRLYKYHYISYFHRHLWCRWLNQPPQFPMSSNLISFRSCSNQLSHSVEFFKNSPPSLRPETMKFCGV